MPNVVVWYFCVLLEAFEDVLVNLLGMFLEPLREWRALLHLSEKALVAKYPDQEDVEQGRNKPGESNRQVV